MTKKDKLNLSLNLIGDQTFQETVLPTVLLSQIQKLWLEETVTRLQEKREGV